MIASLKLLASTFVIASILNLITRLISEERMPMLNIIKDSAWMAGMQDYFKRTTPLQAALVAGFIAAVAQYLIVMIRAPPSMYNNASNLAFLWISFIVGAFVGELVRRSGVFPDLRTTLYAGVTRMQAIFVDGSSMTLVNAVFLFALQIMKLRVI